MNNSVERIYEENKLSDVLKEIKLNLDYYNDSMNVFKNRLKVVSDDNEVTVIFNYLDLIEKNIRNNSNSLLNPYFARIDFFDNNENKNYTLYIGKHGIQDSNSQTLTVDWRAPISSVYYDCQLGSNKIETYEGEELDFELNLKRTIEIEDSRLIDCYDVDTIANDELLTKYLAKNKEAVLSEIVATIQKDQNEIIRDGYSHNIIVQGGAGSGKTTVAMHRVSFLLYNYKDMFSSENFYILGSNKMFLNYITSILPSLDVGDIKNMVLSSFLYEFVSDYMPKGKGKYNFIEKWSDDNKMDMAFKGKIGFVKALDSYLKKYEYTNIPIQSIKVNDNIIMDKANILSLLETFNEKSMQEKIAILNEQLKNKLVSFKENNRRLNIGFDEKEFLNYFGDKKKKINIISIYLDFLTVLKEKFESNNVLNVHVKNIDSIIATIKDNKFDIFDLSMLNLIKKRICTNKRFESVSYIVVDEAQDFGVSIFYVLKNVFNKSYFAIMGDISQNINYDIGMNDWEGLINEVFTAKNDRFYTLSKSYRNTIEISNVACEVLKKATFKTYEIEPFVRHGKEVEIINTTNFEEMINLSLKLIDNIFKNDYKTIGIICRTDEEAKIVSDSLSKYIDVISINGTDVDFANGVMVMPIYLSKGLEFDAVILWDVNKDNYTVCDADIKLLYVAITRALHELYLLYNGDLTKLI